MEDDEREKEREREKEKSCPRNQVETNIEKLSKTKIKDIFNDRVTNSIKFPGNDIRVISEYFWKKEMSDRGVICRK